MCVPGCGDGWTGSGRGPDRCGDGGDRHDCVAVLPNPLPDVLRLPVWRGQKDHTGSVSGVGGKSDVNGGGRSVVDDVVGRVVRPPGSKSLTNRLLLLAALAEGESVIRGAVVDADDAKRMLSAISRLGAAVRVAREQDGTPMVVVEGVGGAWEPDGSVCGSDGVRLDLGNAGTATRFLAASAALTEPGCGPIVIDGNDRMRERPIGALVEMLRALGVRVDELGRAGYPPVRVWPMSCCALPPGESESDVDAHDACAKHRRAPVLNIPSTLSSQYVSALMLAAPFLPTGLELRYESRPTSPSYVEMTVRVLRRVGVDVRVTGSLCAGGDVPAAGSVDSGESSDKQVEATKSESDGLPVIRIHPAAMPAEDLGELADHGVVSCLLPPFSIDVEPDASGATYFWACAASVPGLRVVVPGLGEDSLQGDAAFVNVLERMGAHVEWGELKHVCGGSTTREPFIAVTGGSRLRGVESDFSLMPDAAMTLAALACVAEGPTTIWGLRTLRVKETDRIRAMEIELSKVGAVVEVLSRPMVSGSGVSEGVDEGIRVTPPTGKAGEWLRRRRGGLGGEEIAAGVVADGPERVVFETYDDHRMAMSLSIVGLHRENCCARDPGCVNKTYPGFWKDWWRVVFGAER